jgi:hypothetical protein
MGSCSSKNTGARNPKVNGQTPQTLLTTAASSPINSTPVQIVAKKKKLDNIGSADSISSVSVILCVFL